ncbi:MAG: hypothetical protein HKN16_07075 [Saprospiraceae bacterium]|nr:hypothetical protein [Saprospiraceae bacterium]
MQKLWILVVMSGLVGLYLFSCSTGKMHPSGIDFSKVPFEHLSDYGFFKGEQNKLMPSPGVLPYRPASELFSDHAEKSRFVWMPEGASASILDTGYHHLAFPDKSILIKNFYYSQSENEKQRIIETRLLIKMEGEWNAFAYLWNDKQTEAKYEIVGATIPVTFTETYGTKHSIEYIQPNKNQCKSCHNQGEKLVPIGPKVRNLNFAFDYGNGEMKNQLTKWREAGYLESFDQADLESCMVDYEDKTSSLGLRSKAYLDINCAHCHSPKGPASSSGLFLTYEEKDPTRWGVYKTPVAAGFGAGSFTYGIQPGKADSSIFIHRMKSEQVGVMMPEIGRAMVHKEGVELISEWINSMD